MKVVNLTLSALLVDNLVELSHYFKIFNNIRVFVGDENKVHPFDREVHVSNAVRLNVRALFA